MSLPRTKRSGDRRSRELIGTTPGRIEPGGKGVVQAPPGRSRPGRGSMVSPLFVRREGENVELCRLPDLSLRGAHNLKNSLAAAATANILGASVESIAGSLRCFSGLPHRLQQIGTRDGIVYVDDSAATTPEAAAAAVRCFAEPVQLIAGGSGKGSDFAALGEAVAASNVKAVLPYGRRGRIRSCAH